MAARKKKAPARNTPMPSPAEIGGALGAGALAAILSLVSDIVAGVERRHVERLAFDEKKLAQEAEIALKQLDFAEKMDMHYETFARAALDWMDSKNAVKG